MFSGRRAVGERLEGRQVSLWVATTGTTRYPSLDTDLEVDVAVVGGGIAGLTAALALKRAGSTVAVLEAARIGTGVTGHTTGKVTSLHRLAYTELADRHGPDVAGTYGQANQAAIEHIARVVAEEGIDCDFRRVSNYTYAESDDALARVRGEAALAGRLGLPAVFTSEVPLPFGARGAVRFDGQAQLHAVKYLQGLARAVDGSGSHVLEDSRVTSVRDGVPAVVETGSGTVRAREVIIATNVPVGDAGCLPGAATCTVPTSLPAWHLPCPWTGPSSASTSRCAPSWRSTLRVPDSFSPAARGTVPPRPAMPPRGTAASRLSPGNASAPGRPASAGPRRTTCPSTGCPTPGR